MTITALADIMESILFVAGDAVETSVICEKLDVTEFEVLSAADILRERFNSQRGINIIVFNGKLQLCSNPNYVAAVSAVLNPVREKELTKAMLETLSVIAYKQPITKTEIEDLRGVDSTYALAVLTKLNMVYVAGRKDAIGKPLLYATTDEFLKRFSLSSLSDLPDAEELMDRISALKTEVSERKNLFGFNEDGSLDFAVKSKDVVSQSSEEADLTLTQSTDKSKIDGSSDTETKQNCDESNSPDELGDIRDEIPDFLDGDFEIVEAEDND